MLSDMDLIRKAIFIWSVSVGLASSLVCCSFVLLFTLTLSRVLSVDLLNLQITAIINILWWFSSIKQSCFNWKSFSRDMKKFGTKVVNPMPLIAFFKIVNDQQLRESRGSCMDILSPSHTSAIQDADSSTRAMKKFSH